MKKQLLLLVLLLAFFAGISKVNAQCVPDELHPAAGIEYTYSADITGPGYSGSGQYDWYITDNVNLIDATFFLTPGVMFTVNAATPYHDAANGVDNIQITWTPAAVADMGPFYLVLRYRETNANADPTCSSENIKAWQIDPINTFLLALEGGTLTSGSYVATEGSNTCAADVTGAAVTVGTPGTVLLTYGENTIYYVATASGIEGDWRPSIRVPALLASQTYVAVEWTANMTGAGGWVDMGVATTGATQDLVSPSDATCTDVDGTPILIRVRLLNNNWQTLANQDIVLAIDGYLPTAYAVSDIVSATDCTTAAPFAKTGTFTINARPTITGTPATMVLTNP